MSANRSTSPMAEDSPQVFYFDERLRCVLHSDPACSVCFKFRSHASEHVSDPAYVAIKAAQDREKDQLQQRVASVTSENTSLQARVSELQERVKGLEAILAQQSPTVAQKRPLFNLEDDGTPVIREDERRDGQKKAKHVDTRGKEGASFRRSYPGIDVHLIRRKSPCCEESLASPGICARFGC